MTHARPSLANDTETIPGVPAWASSRGAETNEDVAFLSGAALTVLDTLVSDPAHGVPVKLLANRLALKAATATSKLEGRLAREADLRDACHLTQPGEARGPDGDLLAFWRQTTQVKLTGREWLSDFSDLMGSDFGDAVDGWVKAGRARTRSHGPFAGCALVMRRVLEVDDRAERVACLLSDVVLARSLNWQRVMPISAIHLTKTALRDLSTDGGGGELDLQARLLGSLQDIIVLARDLARRAATLRAVAPKLRARGSEAAAALFLSEDAVAPASMLSPMIRGTTIPMTDRAARRFCDRLVELGVVRELTGRPTFRLYGL